MAWTNGEVAGRLGEQLEGREGIWSCCSGGLVVVSNASPGYLDLVVASLAGVCLPGRHPCCAADSPCLGDCGAIGHHSGVARRAAATGVGARA